MSADDDHVRALRDAGMGPASIAAARCETEAAVRRRLARLAKLDAAHEAARRTDLAGWDRLAALAAPAAPAAAILTKPSARGPTFVQAPLPPSRSFAPRRPRPAAGSARTPARAADVRPLRPLTPDRLRWAGWFTAAAWPLDQVARLFDLDPVSLGDALGLAE